jgi:hypothetical protein
MAAAIQQLQMLQDGSAPNFVAEVVTLFCEDGERIIGELAKLLYVCFILLARFAMFCLIRCLILCLGIWLLCVQGQAICGLRQGGCFRASAQGQQCKVMLFCSSFMPCSIGVSAIA